MNTKSNKGYDPTEFHRCDAPLVDDESISAVVGVTEATGTCEQAPADPNQWNRWAQLVRTGALSSQKPD